MRTGWIRAIATCAAMLAWAPRAAAQTVSQRGFIDAASWLFAQRATNDPVRVVGDLLLRDDVFYKPAAWLQFSGGMEARVNSHDQVDDRWRIDFSDRGPLRPAVSVRRLSATLTRGPLTLDVGKQFIRWGKTDIVTPTDRFAPRDFLNVVDGEFLAVTGVRGTLQFGGDTIEAAWTPRMTPSRTPLLTQRWTVLTNSGVIPIVDAGAVFPTDSQVGIRWSHAGRSFEYSLAAFDGVNHLPAIAVTPRAFPPAIEFTRVYPAIRMFGADVAMPSRWFTLKAETAYVRSSSPLADDYVLYVVQVERQRGEWLFLGGYAGEVVTETRAPVTFAPDRGLSRAFVGRASYTIDPNRSVVFETAVRQNGRGAYAKAEYSQARGDHWRVTAALRVIGGTPDDFLGQYRRNSHGTLTLRYSF